MSKIGANQYVVSKRINVLKRNQLIELEKKDALRVPQE